MTRQEHPQFTVYAVETAVPGYQRAWVWGLGALAILLCGMAAGWLFGGAPPAPRESARAGDVRSVDGTALLARQETVNRRLRERIAGLERALAGDACTPTALKALTQGAKD